MARKYSSTITVGSYNVGSAEPLDVRMVVENVSDLLPASLLTTTYVGMVVYVLEDSSLYVCYSKPKRATQSLTNVEDGWKKVDVDYSVHIVESESNLTDGTTILFPYQGMMAYVTSESALYVLLTNDVDKAKDINNWRKISNSSSTLVDKVGIDVAPEGGSGFKITSNKGVIIDDYINVDNYIKADYFYTSKGVNSFESNPYFTYDSVRLSRGGDSYIELYANGDNWMVINDPDNSFGLSINIEGKDFISGEPIAKNTPVCFGVDIQFTDGWIIVYGNTSRPFVESDYELIDIYRSEYSPEVYAYLKDIDIRLLTEDDIVAIDDQIKNLQEIIGNKYSEDSDNESIVDRLEDLEKDGEKYKPAQSLIDATDLISDVHGGLGSHNAAWFKEQGYTYSQMFDAILFPTVKPTMTAPSLSWKEYSTSYNKLVGSDITSLVLTNDNIANYVTPNLGSWSLDINSNMTASKECGTINVSATGSPIDNGDGTYSMGTSTIKYQAYAKFVAGNDPKDNKGNVCTGEGYYSESNVYTSAAYIYPYYNFYATTNQSAPGELILQTVIKSAGISTVTTTQGKINLAPHTAATPWKIRLPKKLQTLWMLNTSNGKYEVIEMLGDAPKMWKYEQETTTENGINYHLYTYIGSDNNSANIQIKF